MLQMWLSIIGNQEIKLKNGIAFEGEIVLLDLIFCNLEIKDDAAQLVYCVSEIILGANLDTHDDKVVSGASVHFSNVEDFVWKRAFSSEKDNINLPAYSIILDEITSNSQTDIKVNYDYVFKYKTSTTIHKSINNILELRGFISLFFSIPISIRRISFERKLISEDSKGSFSNYDISYYTSLLNNNLEEKRILPIFKIDEIDNLPDKYSKWAGRSASSY